MFLLAVSPITEVIMCFCAVLSLPLMFIAVLVMLFKKTPAAPVPTPQPLPKASVPEEVLNATPAQPRRSGGTQPAATDDPRKVDPIKDATVAYQKLEEVAVYLASQNVEPAKIGEMFTTFVSRSQPKPKTPTIQNV